MSGCENWRPILYIINKHIQFLFKKDCIHSPLESMVAHLLYLFFSVCKDELEVRYKLHSSKDVEVLWSRVSNVADGLLHSVSIRRLENTVSVQVKKK